MLLTGKRIIWDILSNSPTKGVNKLDELLRNSLISIQPHFLAEELFSLFSSLRDPHRWHSDRGLAKARGDNTRPHSQPSYRTCHHKVHCMFHVHLPAHLVMCCPTASGRCCCPYISRASAKSANRPLISTPSWP